MKYIAIALSERGKIRPGNEDNLYFDGEFRSAEELQEPFRKTLSSSEPVRLFAVCDGMGGESMGEQASYLAVSGLKEIEKHFLQDGGQSFPRLLPRYLKRVNESLCQIMRQNKGRRLGSTFAALLLRGRIAQALNIGDTRVYLFRNGRLNQLSVDHNYAQRLVEMGIITQAEAKTHPERNRLSQHLGLFPEEAQIQPALSPEIWLQEGDSFLICTDGVTEMISEEKISEILQAPLAFLQQAESLMEYALAAGGKDNISLILLKIQELDPDEAIEDTHAETAGAMPAPAGESAHFARPAGEGAAGFAAPDPAAEQTGARPSAEAESAVTAAVPVLAPAAAPRRVAVKDAPYQLSDEELERFEAARRAAIERRQPVAGGEEGQAAQAAGANSAPAPEDPHKRKIRKRPGAGQIIFRALMVFVLFALIGFVVLFGLMNINIVLNFLRKIFGA